MIGCEQTDPLREPDIASQTHRNDRSLLPASARAGEKSACPRTHPPAPSQPTVSNGLCHECQPTQETFVAETGTGEGNRHWRGWEECRGGVRGSGFGGSRFRAGVADLGRGAEWDLVAKTEGLDAEEVKLPVQIVHR
eukprot:1857715-Rhodomonas_salina.1